MSKRFSQVLVDHICRQESILQGLLALCGVVFLVLIVSLTVVESGSATYVITVIDLVSVTVVGVITGAMLRTCRARREEREK